MTLRHLQLQNVKFDNQYSQQGDSREELLEGLKRTPKTIDPKFFYDAKGSALFDQITQLPEYYPTRTEITILQQYSNEIANYCGRQCVLIEPGSGSSEKVRLLLDTLRPKVYVPLDISADFLYESALRLGLEFPWLQIHAICADFANDLTLTAKLPPGKRVVFYPGSTIGNMEPREASLFLSRLRNWIDVDGGALIGVDLHKSTQCLNAAYNDSKGITADFNLNVLDHINPLLEAQFDRNNFSHRAFYNTEKQRIEMHLVSKQNQRIHCNGSVINFAKGETIHTENSYKYTLEGFSRIAADAGMLVRQSWLDDEQLFSVHYLEPADSSTPSSQP